MVSERLLQSAIDQSLKDIEYEKERDKSERVGITWPVFVFNESLALACIIPQLVLLEKPNCSMKDLSVLYDKRVIEILENLPKREEELEYSAGSFLYSLLLIEKSL